MLVAVLGAVAMALAVVGCADAAASAPVMAAPAVNAVAVERTPPPPLPRQIKFVGPEIGNGPAVYGVSVNHIEGVMVIPPGEYGANGRGLIFGFCTYERVKVPSGEQVEYNLVSQRDEWRFFTVNLGEALVITGPCTWYSGAYIRAGGVQ